MTDDGQELVFETQPEGIFSIFGFVALFFGLLMLLVFCEPYQLSCERGGECTLWRGGVLGGSTQRFPAAELHGATVEERRGSKGSRTYRTVLVTAGGALPLTSISSGGRAGYDAEAARIRTFAEGGVARLSVTNRALLPLAIGLGATPFGLWLLVLGTRRWRGVLRAGGLELERRDLAGRRTFNHPPGTLASIRASSFGRINRRPVQRVVLTTTSGATAFSAVVPEGESTTALLNRLGETIRQAQAQARSA